MTFPIIPASTVSGSYQISRSLRFRSSASAYLSKTFSSTATSNQKLTYSTWIKRGSEIGAAYSHFGLSAAISAGYRDAIRTVSDAINIYFNEGGSYNIQTTPVFRDPSAWYHILVAIDTTQATASNRVLIYVNGSQITTFSAANYPIQNYNFTGFLVSGKEQNIGRNPAPAFYYDGYLAETYCIDGLSFFSNTSGASNTSFNINSFGQSNALTGVWEPKQYTGTYGTNGFYLPFSDNSALTTSSNAGIGKDFSGNSNYWVTNNISITSGTTYDSMIDSPTNYADGGNGRGNYAVLNPVNGSTNASITEGNLSATGTTANYASNQATFNLTSGKWYFEMTKTTTTANVDGLGLVVSTYNKNSTSAGDTGSYVITDANPSQIVTKSNGGASVTVSTTNWANNDVIQCAYDADSGKVWFGRNGTWYPATNGGTVGDPAAGTNPTITAVSGLTPIIITYNTSSTNKVNFGQRPFAYTPPSGFSALNTQNLPTPTIAAGNKYFDVVTRGGTGGVYTKTGLGFQPDFAWTKLRNTAYNHYLQDSVRGVAKQLSSDTTTAEQSITNAYTAFNADGYTLGSSTAVNDALYTYVDWLWKAGGTGVSNTSGTITSTVSANTSAGFSVVTYTGTGAAASVGHGLGVAPTFVIFKQRNGANSWLVLDTIIGGSPGYTFLNTTDARSTLASGWAPDSTKLNFAASSTVINTNTNTYVAYCFAPVAGYSAFGSYTGNGSATDGPMIFTNMKPRWVMIKRYDAGSANDWYIFDTSRNTYNAVNSGLFPSLSSAEITQTTYDIDFLSNGFKFRNANNALNASGGTYIYAAFAENPFKYSRAR